MKKILYSLLGLFMLLIPTLSANAATLNISLSQSNSKIVVGNYITYTVRLSSSSAIGGTRYSFTYDSSKLTLISGTPNGLSYDFHGTEKSITYTFKFKAKASGNTTVNFVLNEAIDWDGNNFSYNKTTSKTTQIITQKELEASYSKNNYLSSLAVDNYSLSPSFNKNTLEYTLTLENDVRRINVTGNKEDSKASITGLGKHDLAEGLNKIEILVTAQNGSTRTYIINATVKELSPIVVEVDGKKYNVVRKEELLTAPNSTYESTTIKIGEEEVPAFTNKKINITLVGLKDEEGNIALYKYDNEKYTIYQEIQSKGIIIIEAPTQEIPKKYQKVTLKINEKTVTAYQKDTSSSYYLLYGTNIENGKTNLYQYDSKENTLQIFDLTSLKRTENKEKKYAYMILGLGTILVITYFILLISAIRKKVKSKKKKNEFKKENIKNESTKILEDLPKDENIIQEVTEEVTIEEVQESKKDKKKKKKK